MQKYDAFVRYSCCLQILSRKVITVKLTLNILCNVLIQLIDAILGCKLGFETPLIKEAQKIETKLDLNFITSFAIIISSFIKAYKTLKDL